MTEVIHFMLIIFIRYFSCIALRRNNVVTYYFTISNGVKQGGVLSPVLLSRYMDQFISQIKHIGMGCYTNCLFTRVLYELC